MICMNDHTRDPLFSVWLIVVSGILDTIITICIYYSEKKYNTLMIRGRINILLTRGGDTY